MALDQGQNVNNGYPAYAGDASARSYGMGRPGQVPAPQPGGCVPQAAGAAGQASVGQQPAPQWYVGPDGTYYMMGPDGRLYPVALGGAAPAAGKKKRKHGAGFWVAIVLAVVCIVVAVLIALNMCGQQSRRSGELGSVAGMSQEQIQDELDRVVQAGMFDISIAAQAEFADGTSEGELKIENPESNRFLMKVDVTRDDNGESVYQTDMIEPGYVVYSDRLSQDLPAGTYPCTAVFTAYDEAEEEVGTAAAKITIVVDS